MSNNYIKSVAGKKGEILIEVAEKGGSVGFGAGLPKKADDKPGKAFEQALNTIQLAADDVLKTLEKLDERPDSARVDFGIKFDSDSNAMLANNSGDAQLKVSLSWNVTKPDEEKA